MPIQKPIVTEIAYKTYLINEFGLDVMYLLVGTSGRCSSTPAAATLT